MTVISKLLFYERVSPKISCDDIHSWHPNCTIACLMKVQDLLLGSLKFFGPIYIVKAMIYYKKLNRKYLKSLFIEQMRSTIYAILFAGLFIISNCIMCKLTGRIHYYNLGVMAGVFGGLSILAETKENKILDTLIFFNVFLEAIFSNLNFYNIFNLTNTRLTVMFMMSSSALMYLLQNRQKKIGFTHFWFFTPTRKSLTLNPKECDHKSCEKFSFDGMKNYFLFGYLVNIIKTLIPKMALLVKEPKRISNLLVNRKNFKSGLFFATYVGLYRYIMCYLLKHTDLSAASHGAIAGLFSGATFSIFPNLQTLIIALTTILQIIYEKVQQKLNLSQTDIPRQLLFMLCSGVLVHNRIYSAGTCPSYFINMLNLVSNNVFGNFHSRFISKFFL